jgi:hypothetical protein
VAPVAPVEPGGPCIPCGPGGPCVPVILLSFLSSLSLSNFTCLQNSTELTKKPSNGPVLHSYLFTLVDTYYMCSHHQHKHHILVLLHLKKLC